MLFVYGLYAMDIVRAGDQIGENYKVPDKVPSQMVNNLLATINMHSIVRNDPNLSYFINNRWSELYGYEYLARASGNSIEDVFRRFYQLYTKTDVELEGLLAIKGITDLPVITGGPYSAYYNRVTREFFSSDYWKPYVLEELNEAYSTENGSIIRKDFLYQTARAYLMAGHEVIATSLTTLSHK